ncbi:MAG: aldehyde ferredoxin oxidoreductase N-terminal domain-containing protein [Promethearchaeota archaeon]
MSSIPQDILEINLTAQEVQRYSRPELFEKWIGGIGVAINLLNEHVPPNADPLGPENAVIFAIGSLNTFFPIVSKTVVTFKSPLTGDLGESYAGGRLSLAMRFSGLGAIIIKGTAEKSSYITILDDQVEIKRAGPLAYMYTTTLGRVLRELVPVGPGRRSSIRIGPASENLVKYGNIIVDSFRHFGRLGCGTVLGAKKIKAIVISGEKDLSLEELLTDRRTYLKTYQTIWDSCVKTDVMKKYHVLGTAQNILPLNELNALPTRNFTKGRFEHANDISGEKFAETYLGRRVACNTCPVGCIHVAILRERYGVDSPADIHSIAVPYDHEPIGMLGSTLELVNGIQVLKLIEQSERFGIDAITVGVILGWLAEAYEKGIINDSDTNGQPIRFGYLDDFISVIKNIANRDPDLQDLYWLAGEGLDALVERYSDGKQFAVRFNNNSPAAYSTGPYNVIGHIIGGRHSHLDNAGYSYDQKTIGKTVKPDEAISKLCKEEEWRNILNSLIVCLFARNLYTPSLVSECLGNLGIFKTESELLNLGLEIQELRLKTKFQFGYQLQRIRDKLPKRIYEMPTAHGILLETNIETLLDAYEDMLRTRYKIKI